MKILFGVLILLVSIYSSYESLVVASQKIQSSPIWIIVLVIHFVFVYVFAYFFNKERKLLTGRKSLNRSLYLLLSLVTTLVASFMFLGVIEIVSTTSRWGGYPYVLPYIVIVLVGFGLYFKED